MKYIMVSGFVIYLCIFWVSITAKEVERIMEVANVDGLGWMLTTILMVLSKALFSSLVFGLVFYIASNFLK